MSSLNAVTLVGNLTDDPQEIASGKGCQLGVAINDRVKRGEEWQDHVSFFDVVVWGKQAENCVKYLSKGSLAGIAGKLRQERWEKDGNKRSAVRVYADTVSFLGSKNDKKKDNDDGIPF